ncbi:MAG TPA: D-alanine--D-serine ligase VanG [Mobilitalea sp.]|nr:D-alanine--D-serine ligase VanG [Mobilitalea sp.]
MRRKKIAIIFGGCSSEYPVSLQSAYAIISNIDARCYETILVGINREGSWFRYIGNIEDIKDDTWHKDENVCIPVMISPDRKLHGIIELRNESINYVRIDAAFPVLHGKNGEDGTVQGLVELAGIPLIGCGTLCSALCMDKDRAHKLVQAEDISVPRSIVISKHYDNVILFDLTRDLNYPVFVKPVKAGSSFGITKVYEKKDLSEAVKLAFTYDNEVIIEENIEGFEVGCAIMGNQELIVGEVDEIELAEGFFDYTEKYTLKSSQIHMPARIDQPTTDRVKQTAAAIYKTLGCKGFARVDMFLTPDNRIVFNEVNTIPGFTSHSRYPNMMKGIGLPFKELLSRLIELGMKE